MNTSCSSRCQNLLKFSKPSDIAIIFVTQKSYNSDFTTNTTGRSNGRIRAELLSGTWMSPGFKGTA